MYQIGIFGGDMNADNKAIIIYLEDNILLSKKEYSNWQEVQDEYFEKYRASLQPMTCEEIISFFEDDFKEEKDWPFSRQRIVGFFRGEEIVIQSD